MKFIKATNAHRGGGNRGCGERCGWHRPGGNRGYFGATAPLVLQAAPTAQSKRAFTMIELIIVLVVVGILGSLAISKLAATSAQQRAQEFAAQLRAANAELANLRIEKLIVGKNLSEKELLDEATRLLKNWTKSKGSIKNICTQGPARLAERLCKNIENSTQGKSLYTFTQKIGSCEVFVALYDGVLMPYKLGGDCEKNAALNEILGTNFSTTMP